MKIALLFLLFNMTFANAASVYCSNGDCTAQDANSVIAYSNGNLDKTVIWVSSIIDSTLNIINPMGQHPRDANIFVRNQDSSKNLNVSVGSTIQDVPGGRIDLYTDIFDILDIDVSTNNGTNGKNSSEVCADQFKSGSLGPAASQYWNNRSNLSTSNCTATDGAWMDSQFSCPAGYVEQATDSVSVSGIVKKNKCIGSYITNRCVKRTYDLLCRYDIVRRKRDSATQSSFELYDHDSYYFSPPYGSVFDSSRSTITDSSSFSGKSGRYFDITYRVTEKKLSMYADQDSACKDLFINASNFSAYWEENLIDTNGDPYTNHITNTSATLEYSSTFDSESRQFLFPLPDSGVDSKGNTFDLDKISIIIKPFDSTGFYRYKNDIDSRIGFTNCIGLNGSLTKDKICDRTPGPAFTFVYRIMDQYGVLSNELSVYVPEGRSAPRLAAQGEFVRGGFNGGTHGGMPTAYFTDLTARGCDHPLRCLLPVTALWSPVYGWKIVTFTSVFISPGFYQGKITGICPDSIFDSKKGSSWGSCFNSIDSLYDTTFYAYGNNAATNLYRDTHLTNLGGIYWNELPCGFGGTCNTPYYSYGSPSWSMYY